MIVSRGGGDIQACEAKFNVHHLFTRADSSELGGRANRGLARQRWWTPCAIQKAEALTPTFDVRLAGFDVQRATGVQTFSARVCFSAYNLLQPWSILRRLLPELVNQKFRNPSRTRFLLNSCDPDRQLLRSDTLEKDPTHPLPPPKRDPNCSPLGVIVNFNLCKIQGNI